MQLPIPDDWNGEDTCRWAVCWPDSPKWKAILYGLIEMPMQGRLWDFTTGGFLSLREQFRPIYDANFNLGEVIMACNDPGIATALENIAIALNAQAIATANSNARANAIASASGGDCCANTIINQGGGVNGRIELPDGSFIPRYGTEDPLSIPPGEWPTGYANREEYDLDKCQISNLIIDGLISSLRTLGAISGAQTGAALALLIIASITASIIFPPAAVGIVAAAFGVGTVIFTVLLQAVNYIQENRQEWVCALYESDTTDEIIGIIAGLISAMIAALLIPSAVAAALTTIILTLLSTDTLNQLFRLQAHLTYPDADCTCAEDLCPDVQPYWDGTVHRGTVTQTGPGTYHVESVNLPGFYHNVTLLCNMEPDTLVVCDGPRAYRISNLSGYVPAQGATSVYIFVRSGMETPGTYWFVGENPILCVSNVHSYDIRSSNPFSFDLLVNETPCE